MYCLPIALYEIRSNAQPSLFSEMTPSPPCDCALAYAQKLSTPPQTQKDELILSQLLGTILWTDKDGKPACA